MDGDAHPELVSFDQRKYLLVGDRLNVADDQELFIVFHKQGDVFTEEGEGRIGDYDVGLFQKRDALSAAEVSAFGEARAAVRGLLQEDLDIIYTGRAVSVDILHVFDLDGDRLGLLALTIVLVVLEERELFAGNWGAVVTGGDELFQTKSVEVGCEVFEEVAFEGVVAITVDDLTAKGVPVELQISLNLFLDVNVLSVELILLGRLRGTEISIHLESLQ